MASTIADLRREYRDVPLNESDVMPDPIAQFERWFDDALRAAVADPTVMTLATATPDARPSARMVLLKHVDARGFAFFTNYESRKAGELDRNARAALVFWWPELDRQVRVEGRVRRVSDDESTQYFLSRPRGSQLGAWASPQSRVLESRAALEERLADVTARFGDGTLERPPFWGGYRVEPDVVEFWQGRPSRLHDRIRYALGEDGTWQIDRLAP